MGVLGFLILATGFLAAALNGGIAGALSFVLFPLQQLLWATSGFFIEYRTAPNFIVATAVAASVAREFLLSPQFLYGSATVTVLATTMLYAWAALTLLWTPSFESGTEMMLQGIPYFILMVLLVPLAIQGIGQVGALRLGILVWGTATLASIAIAPEFTYWSGRLVFQFSSEARTNPLALGELGGLMLLAAALDTGERRSGWMLTLRLAAVATGLVGMLQSGSRGQLIGAVIVAIAFTPIARRIDNLRRFATTSFVILVVVAIVPVLASQLLESAVLNRWDAGDLQAASSGRLENIVDIFMVWTKAPFAWIIGLGANAFSTVTDARFEGWIHNLTAELTFEFGAIGLSLFALVLTCGTRDSVWLFRHFRSEPVKRADLAFLLGATVFELFLAQKQSHLWGDTSLFGLLCVLSRIRRYEGRLIGDDAKTLGDGLPEP